MIPIGRLLRDAPKIDGTWLALPSVNGSHIKKRFLRISPKTSYEVSAIFLFFLSDDGNDELAFFVGNGCSFGNGLIELW